MKNLKLYRFRSYNDDNYLIPDDVVETFDSYTDQIDEMDGQDEYYDMCEKFTSIFNKYVVEGDLYSIELWINPDEL